MVIKDKKDIDKVKGLLANRNVKKFDARKLCGVLKFKEDALKIQERLRYEWE